MTTVLTPTPVQGFRDNNGNPLASGKLFTYQAGTSIPAATYTDSTGGTPNANPIVLNARGECNLWLTPNTAYKFVLQDSLGNTIWTVDQVTSSQLVTLYGGVDTGAVNAYVLNFTANFSSYFDGIIIYWIPSQSNTSGSTINVNGLGVVNILNQDGTALYVNEIVANRWATIAYRGGNFYLLSTTGNAAFAASRITTAQNMPVNVITDCIFNSTTTNQASAYNTTTGVFTAPNYGIYHFDASIGLLPAGTNAVLNSIYFSKNNATSGAGLRFDLSVGVFGQQYSNTGNSARFTGGVTIEMNAGDTMRVKWDAGGSGAGVNQFAISSSFGGAKVA
jgi:hypothetical protein